MKKTMMSIISVLLFIIMCCFEASAGTWEVVGDNWKYRDNSGNYAAGKWEKDTDGLWYYFDENGFMVRNQWINDEYYVGSSGAMMTNTITPDGYKVWNNGKKSDPVDVLNPKYEHHNYFEGYYNGKLVKYNIYYKDKYITENLITTIQIHNCSIDGSGNLFAHYRVLSGTTNMRIPVTGSFRYDGSDTYGQVKLQYLVLYNGSKTEKIPLEMDPNATEVNVYLGSPWTSSAIKK